MQAYSGREPDRVSQNAWIVGTVPGEVGVGRVNRAARVLAERCYTLALPSRELVPCFRLSGLLS